MLIYRHRSLQGAKIRAQISGWRGASYAWESALSGRDMTPSQILPNSSEPIPVFTGTQEIHITADVAYAVIGYWEATRDDAFLADYGAEILIETGRFWASRVTRRDGAYHIDGVMGPDEYHYDVSDNAYTNWMARFNLQKAAWVVRWLKEKNEASWLQLAKRIQIEAPEVDEWLEIAGALFIPSPNLDGVIEQFSGFFKLEIPQPLEMGSKSPATARPFDWREANRLRVIKQADVLMIPSLFPDSLPREVVRACYDYYEPLTDHGSSLSPAVYAAIAADIGRTDLAKRYWIDALHTDPKDEMQNSALGIHLASAGGVWQALVFHLLKCRETPHSLYCKHEKGENQ